MGAVECDWRGGSAIVTVTSETKDPRAKVRARASYRKLAELKAVEFDATTTGEIARKYDQRRAKVTKGSILQQDGQSVG